MDFCSSLRVFFGSCITEIPRQAGTQKRLPPWGKLAAKLTDEGDIRPLPFKASNAVACSRRKKHYSERTLPPHPALRATFPTRGKAFHAETQRGFPLGGKLAAKLTDEGDIRPLPIDASKTAGRALNERPYGFYRNVFTLSVGCRIVGDADTYRLR